MTEQLWAFEIERMGMVTDLDPYIDSLICAVGGAIETFRAGPKSLPATMSNGFAKVMTAQIAGSLTTLVSSIEAVMNWVEENQLECSVSCEHIGHDTGNGKRGNVVHIRLLLVMDESAATVFRLYHPDMMYEPFERHWKELKTKWPRETDEPVRV